MYVYEEIINGRKLTEIINETHENVKYLPGHKIPENVVSDIEVFSALLMSFYLVFVFFYFTVGDKDFLLLVIFLISIILHLRLFFKDSNIF